MSDVDNMNALVAQAKALPSAVAGLTNVWVTPGNAGAPAFTVQLDPNSAYWSIYDSTAYVWMTGHGSEDLRRALIRLRVNQ